MRIATRILKMRQRASARRDAAGLMQRTRERAPAQQLREVRLLLEDFGQRARDVLEDLAVLLRREARRNADVRDEELVVLAAHRKSAQFRTAREERLHLLLKLG